MAEIVRRWQYYNPASGDFDLVRSTRDYARLLGVSESLLSHIYAGRKEPGKKVVLGLLRAFPCAATEIGALG